MGQTRKASRSVRFVMLIGAGGLKRSSKGFRQIAANAAASPIWGTASTNSRV